MNEMTDSSTLLVKTWKALQNCLGLKKLGSADFGQIIGYDGSNIPATIQKIETGKTGLSGPAMVRLKDLLQSASYCHMPIATVPEWSWLESSHEDGDGSSLYLHRNWFPRMIFCATVQAGPALTDLNFDIIGYIHNPDPDIASKEVYCLHVDILPKEDWYATFYNTAIDLFKDDLDF